MVKSCKSCKALKYCGATPKCQLGYPIDVKNTTPLEPCPKPLTYLQLIEYRNELILKEGH